MKRLNLILCTAIASITVACTSVDQNVLMSDFKTPNGTPPYSQITNELYYPAFVRAVEKAKKEIDAIAENPDAPTFKNTIEAMEFSGADLSRVVGVFYNMLSSNTNDTLQDISFKVAPMMTDLANYSSMNETLFKRVKSVYENIENENLTPEQKKLAIDCYKSFTRNGAELSKEDKEIYTKLTKELSQLSLQFDKNTLDATNAYVKEISAKDVEELPEFVKEMTMADAKANNIDGYAVAMQGNTIASFMKYSTNRALKEELWRAQSSRCIGGEYDNTEVINKIVNTRLELAKLLGYNTYAEYVLEKNMAKTPDKVNDFLEELSEKSIGYAKNDIKAVQNQANKMGAKFKVMPWDFSYYANELMEEKYSISDELVKPYFKLENVRDGIFELANRLYGITFTPNTTADKYQEDVMIYDVKDNDGTLLTTLYLDFFPRASKGGGAWMNTIRDQKIVDGVETRPLVTVVCNFTKPTETTPSLLTFYEVTTFLHEFGHALHGLFATGAYTSQSGTSVARDFVELPSQIMENWATQKEFLKIFAKHYQTGEVISDELIDKIIASKNFNAGYLNVRQLSFGLTDMAWHTITENGTFDVPEFEAKAKEAVEVLPEQEGTAMSPSFGHIFAGGYAAGYYSYKWAEVLEADAFQAFLETSIFDRATGEKFRKEVLSKGSTKDAMELYINFRGAEPDTDALFKKYGMSNN